MKKKSKVKPKGVSKEHLEEYKDYSPEKLATHMKEEKKLIKAKRKGKC